MPFRFVPPTYEEGREIMQLPAVRDALKKHADRILPVAKKRATDVGEDSFAKDLKVVEGTRPKGRPYARVIADRADGEKIEHGDSNTVRRRILGSSAGVKL